MAWGCWGSPGYDQGMLEIVLAGLLVVATVVFVGFAGRVVVTLYRGRG